MRSLLVTSIMAAFAPFVSSGDPARPQPALTPDFSAIQREASRLITDRWVQGYADPNRGQTAPPLLEIEIRTIRRADNLLANAAVKMKRVYPLTDKPVYFVNGIARSDWSKVDTEHVLVLRKIPNGFECLFHYDGGWNGSGIDFQVTNVGGSSRQDVLKIDDHASSNGMSQTITHIYRYDDKADQFVEIFDELTSWGPPHPVPTGYRGTLVFEESDAALKDIIVRMQLMDSYDDYVKGSCEARFTWDGTKYQGKMNLPADVEKDLNEFLEQFRRAIYWR